MVNDVGGSQTLIVQMGRQLLKIAKFFRINHETTVVLSVKPITRLHEHHVGVFAQAIGQAIVMVTDQQSALWPGSGLGFPWRPIRTIPG